MKCLGCYREIVGNSRNADYHDACIRRFFKTPEAPTIDVTEEVKALQEGLRIRGAVPGVQRKLSMSMDRTHYPRRLTIIEPGGEFILKPASPEYAELPENEDLTMHLADIVHIPTGDHTLVRTVSGDIAYLTRRFDRISSGPIAKRKRAVEDMCQLSERLTEDKYKGSMEQIARMVRKYSTNPVIDAATLFQLTCFSYLTGNSDMHLKNFSLMTLPSKAITFSPAYDLLSVKLVLPQDEDEMALPINGKQRNITRNDMEYFADYIALSKPQREGIWRSFANARSKWMDMIGRSFLSDDAKERYAAIITTRMEMMGFA